MKAKRTSNSRAGGLQPRSVRMKQANGNKGTEVNINECNVRTNIFELPLIVDSTKERNEADLAKDIKQASISSEIKRQTVKALDNESINKKLKQKEYIEQLQKQIKEKKRIRQEQTILQSDFNSTAINHYWKHKQQLNFPSQEPRTVQKSLSSITGNRRGQVQNRIDVTTLLIVAEYRRGWVSIST